MYMVSQVNSGKFLQGRNTILKSSSEVTPVTSLYEENISLMPNPERKLTKKKLQNNILHKHKCKHSFESQSVQFTKLRIF